MTVYIHVYKRINIFLLLFSLFSLSFSSLVLCTRKKFVYKKTSMYGKLGGGAVFLILKF